MFLDETTTNIRSQGENRDDLTLSELKCISYTGNYERRSMIRNLGIELLVKEHNSLLEKIIKKGTISIDEKNILLSMEQEGTQVGGEFFGKIQESIGVYKIPHQEGMSRYNSLQGTTEILKGETNLRIWSIMI